MAASEYVQVSGRQGARLPLQGCRRFQGGLAMLARLEWVDEHLKEMQSCTFPSWWS